MEKRIDAVRQGVLRLITDESLYLFFAFLFAGVLVSSPFAWHQQAIELLRSYVIVPWSLVLVVHRLMRADAKAFLRRDSLLLAAMFVWVTVPFFLRFGVTFNNMTSWYGHAAVFFAVYALTREEEKAVRGAMFDRLCALFALLSFVLGGLLLICAATGRIYGQGTGMELFGVVNGCLQSGVHYNHTGMISLCMLMMCMAGVSRRKSLPGKAAHLIPALMMAAVVVLTQSRTARYSMLLAFAAGAYGALQAHLPVKKAVLRHAAAIAAACVVLAAGYAGAGAMTDAAIAHYRGMQAQAVQAETVQTEAVQPAAQPVPEAREAADASFSDRTTIWKNLIELLVNDPKYMVIGNGIGRTGSRIVKGTIHEAAGAVAVHNTYLQLVADFGLVGAALTLAFFLTVFFPALRVFFAAGDRRFAGGRALCMLVIACLATGMMESQPLGANTPMNMMLYYALAVLCAEGSRAA